MTNRDYELIKNKFWIRDFRPELEQEPLIKVGDLMRDNTYFRSSFLKKYHDLFPFYSQSAEEEETEKMVCISHESLNKINPIERLFFIDPEIEIKELNKILQSVNITPFATLLLRIKRNSEQFISSSENFKKLIDAEILDKSNKNIFFCQLCNQKDCITFSSEKDCIHNPQKIEIYWIKNRNLLGKWQNNPGDFLESMCFSCLKDFYPQVICRGRIYSGRRGVTTATHLTEFDFVLLDKRIVVLCSINPNLKQEKDQAQFAKKMGFKVLFITPEKDIGNLKCDLAITDILNIPDIKQKILEAIDKLSNKP